MIPVDQGGCCLAMYNGTPIFPSKTEHIMSRYRPIAPKPLAPKPEGTDASEPQSSSSLSVDKSTSRLSEFSKGKRSRKRNVDSSSASRRSRKKVSIAVRDEKVRNGTTGKPTAVVKAKGEDVSLASDMAGLTPILSERVAPVFGPGGLQRFNDSTDQRSLAAALSLSGRSSMNSEGKSYGFGENRSGKLGRPTLVSGGGWNGVVQRIAPSLVDNFVGGRTAGGGSIEKDAAFMERAAASSPAVFSKGTANGISKQKVGGYLGNFREMFKGLPAVAETTANEMTTTSIPPRATAGSSACAVDKSSGSFRSSIMPVAYPSPSYGGESEVCSGEDVVDSRRPNLVTLSLLPDAPLNAHSSLSESSFPSPPRLNSSLPTSTLESAFTMGIDRKEGNGKQATADTNLTMFSKGHWPEEECRQSKYAHPVSKGLSDKWTCDAKLESLGAVAARGFVEAVSARSHATVHFPSVFENGNLKSPVIDSTHLEQIYATSSDAVMLADDQNRMLWSNLAFKRAASEKSNGKLQAVGPHIDPLGIPTQLAVLTFQPPFQARKCKAVLWQFLKKFILQDAGTYFPESSKHLEEKKPLPGHALPCDRRTGSLDTTRVSGDTMVFDGDLSLGLGFHKVISPQPLRPVGSTISIECMRSTNDLASPMTGNLESVQRQLEKLRSPIVITDLRLRVRWVNSAYKQMVGEPECAWLACAVGSNLDHETPPQARLAGEVLLVCADERLPASAAAFSCWARIEWSNCGQQSSISVPTDVTRLDNDSMGAMYVWKFDTSTAGMGVTSGT